MVKSIIENLFIAFCFACKYNVTPLTKIVQTVHPFAQFLWLSRNPRPQNQVRAVTKANIA
jgi:hypothetical protein